MRKPMSRCETGARTVLRRRLAAELEAIDRICQEVRDGALSEIPKEQRFPVELLLREALTNAVLHGARGNPAREICCEIECSGRSVALRVSDDGNGFPWRRYWDATPAAMAESGRGIQILRRYSSALRFNEEGNRVEMIRRFDPGGEDGEF